MQREIYVERKRIRRNRILRRENRIRCSPPPANQVFFLPSFFRKCSSRVTYITCNLCAIQVSWMYIMLLVKKCYFCASKVIFMMKLPLVVLGKSWSNLKPFALSTVEAEKKQTMIYILSTHKLCRFYFPVFQVQGYIHTFEVAILFEPWTHESVGLNSCNSLHHSLLIF